jgi:HAMP domain-containing protein
MKADWKDFAIKLMIQLVTMLLPIFLFISSMNREIGELKTEVKYLHEVITQHMNSIK